MLEQGAIAHGDAAKVDDAIVLVRDRLQPVANGRAGCHGVSMWVNGGAGQVVVSTAWEDESALGAGEEQLSAIRGDVLQLLEAKDARSEVFELAVIVQKRPDEPGFWSRTTETRAPAECMAENIELFTSEVLPAIRQIPGFNTIGLLVNRGEGKAVSNVTYRSREALNTSRERAARLREDSVERLGAVVTNVMELESVIVGIGPDAGLPSQGQPISSSTRATAE